MGDIHLKYLSFIYDEFYSQIFMNTDAVRLGP